MKTGMYLVGSAGPAEIVEQARAASRAGLDSAYVGQVLSWDALTLVALCASAVPGIELGTAVVPTYPRHPIALAGQVLTAQAVADTQITVGVGPSHQALMEGVFGYRYDRPARHIREYLTALIPLLRGEAVKVRGETVTAIGHLDAPVSITPSVLLAALGPVMLRVAGELTDGTVTTWTGPRTVADHIVPRISAAASTAGRPAPRVVCGVIMSVTGDPDRVRADLDAQLGFAGDFPAYRAVLDREGLRGVAETVIAGDEATVERELRRYADAGATELVVGLAGEPAEQASGLALVSALRTAL